MASPPQKKARTSSEKVASPHGSVEVQVQQLELTDLPTSLLVASIFPFLKRIEWNNLSVVNRDVHDSVESHDALLPPWPENCKLRPQPNHDRDLEFPIWSPEGRNIACYDVRDGCIYIFDQCRGHINTWEAHDDHVSSMMYSPDGRLLVSSGHDGRVKIWDCSNEYACIQYFKAGEEHEDAPIRVAFSPDSKLVAVLRFELISLLRVQDGSVVKSFTLEIGCTSKILFSPDDHSLIIGGEDNITMDGVIKVWRFSRPDNALVSVNAANDPVCDLAMSADGSNIASTSDEEIVRLWKLADEGLECIRIFEVPGNSAAYSVSFTPDEKHLAVGGGQFHRSGHLQHGFIWFLKIEDGTCSRVYRTTDSVEELKYSPDGNRLLMLEKCGVYLKSLGPVQNKEEGPKSDEDAKDGA